MPNSPHYLLQLSDLHLSAEPGRAFRGVDADAALRAVIDHARTHHAGAEWLLLSGDLAQGGEAAAYRRLRSYLQPWDIGTSWLPGNHDDISVLGACLGPGLQSRQLGRWRLLLLDSTTEPDGKGGGAMPASELRRLAEELAAASQAGQHCLIGLHHQPMPVDTDWQNRIGLRNAEAFWQTLRSAPPHTLVVFGHLHQAWDLTLQNCRLLGCPSTAAQFRRHTEAIQVETEGRDALPGYRWLKLFDDGQLETGVERVNLA